MKARVFNIQKYSIYDGPGIRTLVFFQGCPLNCLWCSNPEGKQHKPRLLWRGSLCAHCGKCVGVCPNGVHGLTGDPPRRFFTDAKCSTCGHCVQACPADALEISGKSMDIEEIMRIALEDKVFYDVSGGGLTLGGGEPLAQPEAAHELLRQAKDTGLDTAMESCGHCSREALKAAAPLVDLFLFDIKHMDSDRHRELTGVGKQQILDNLKWLLDNGHNVRVRMPLIQGCNADLREMEKRADFLSQWLGKPNFKGVDLLPYHKLGVHKYGQLGESYSLDASANVSDEFLQQAKDIFVKANMPVEIVRH